jgi:lipid-A-disaccharide synthase
MKKIYIIAGEKSGDLHAGRLLKTLRNITEETLQVRGWGGEAMEEAGAELVRHYKETDFMGFFEVVKNLGKIRSFLKEAKEDILNFQPDVVILVDYPGFNLRIAKFAHTNNFKTYYYIAPKVWAWNTKRVHKLRKYVDRVFSILPFEVDFFEKYNVKVDYIGNPLLDEIRDFQPDQDFVQELQGEKPLVALLPGSRTQELKHNLPTMLEAIVPLKEKYRFALPRVAHLPIELYKDCEAVGVEVFTGNNYEILSQAKAALVVSGTATLETALFKVPQVVLYKMNYITSLVARNVIKVPYVSLVNLILNREAVRELLQHYATPEALREELLALLEGSRRDEVLADYAELEEVLRTEGVAERAAKLMVEDWRE